MYKALISFTTKDYDVKLGQILASDFDTQDKIQDFLDAKYIKVYAGDEGIQSNTIQEIWTGTQQQYSTIATLDDNTLYFIEEG